MYKHFFKRLFDFTIALVALLCIGWFLIIIAIWLHFANKGAGAFFTQDRPGKDGKIFKVIKFKTMTDERDTDGNLLPDEARLTKVGRFVRSTSIDELPQLINVLKGDMALIGPRPLLVQYLPLYSKEQMRRHEVRPGISGWAQVHGRNLCKLSMKFEYDVWYVDHIGLSTDIRIFFKTVRNVFARKDVGEGAGNMAEVDDLGFSDARKKLLILGGSEHEVYVVRRAKSMGIYTIVTDMYSPDISPAKKEADEYWDVSWSDIKILKEECKRNHIDGVIAGFSEFRVENLIKLTKELGFPCYCTEEQLEITRDKVKFKAACNKYGVPLVPDFASASDVKIQNFPVIVKPVDRGGSIGITVAYNEKDLEKSVEYAYEMSPSKQIVIEKFMGDGCTKFDVYYLIIDGDIHFIGSSDTVMNHQGKGSEIMQNGWVYPSRFEKEYREGVEHCILDMIKGLSMDNGYITISAFYSKGEFYFFETGFRLSGEQSFDYSEKSIGINYLDFMINYSLGIKKKFDIKQYKSVHSLTLNYYGSPGTIKGVIGADELEKCSEVDSYTQFFSDGTAYGEDKKHPYLAMLTMSSFDKEILERSCIKINSDYDVLDNNNKSIIFNKMSNDMIIKALMGGG